MGTLGFGVDDKEAVFRVLAALLHLGNVRFEVSARPIPPRRAAKQPALIVEGWLADPRGEESR